MKCFHVPGLLLVMGSLSLIGCDERTYEPEADSQGERETARIKAELRLMNLSQDAKSHTLTVGERNAFNETKEIPTQTTQIHEKSYYICPSIRNPRFLIVGKIGVEVSREIEDSTTYESSPKMAGDLNQDPKFHPQRP